LVFELTKGEAKGIMEIGKFPDAFSVPKALGSRKPGAFAFWPEKNISHKWLIFSEPHKHLSQIFGNRQLITGVRSFHPL
jgi:hypothetical protein